METKLIEIRDEGTCIPAMATRITQSDSRILWRAGYGKTYYVILLNLNTMQCQDDPFKWGSSPRTYQAAHMYLLDKWDEIPHEGVCDVRVYLGLADKPAPSDIFR